MKITSRAVRLCFFAIISAVLSALSPAAFARGGTATHTITVSYTLPSKVVEGNMPFAKSFPLHVDVTGDFTGVSAQTVGFNIVPTTIPVGTAAQALSYITVSPATITVTPGSTVSFDATVTVNFPLLDLGAAVTSATFSYQIYTTGWDTSILTVQDPGASVNATASIAPTSGQPPTITITQPADGSSIPFTASELGSSITLQFQAFTQASDPITTYTAWFGNASVTLTASTDPVTGTVTATGQLPIPAAGNYTVTATATNGHGDATTTSTFTISVAGKPTVTIDTPPDGQGYTYRLGSPALSIPVDLTATSTAGAVRTLTATLNGNPALLVLSGIGNATATGTFNASVAGVTSPTGTDVYTIVATTTDDFDSDQTTATFHVTLVKPTPTVTITSPASGDVVTAPLNATTADVPFTFTGTTTNDFTISDVTAALDGAPVAIASTTGLNTAATSSTGTLAGVTAGPHTLTATVTSAGIQATTSVSFTVKLQSAEQPGPGVTIDSPAANAVFTRYVNGPALSIPLTFTGTSNATDGKISNLTATLDNAPLTVSATYGTKSVQGNATMSLSAAGTHTIVVTATDQYGNATTSQTLSVTLLQGLTVSGSVYFDVNGNKTYDASEFGLSGIPVKLKTNAGTVLATTTSAADGSFSFSQVAPGNYTIVAKPYAGLTPTDSNQRNVTVATAALANVNLGYTLDFCALKNMAATGYSLGFWKNNLSKAASGKCSGIQVPKADLDRYTAAIGTLALSPYDHITTAAALTIMQSTSSKTTDLLSKQLLPAEYNYENGAYLNGNGSLTFLFIWWGEYVLQHPTQYSSAYLSWTQSWFEAFNTSEGGLVSGPGSFDGSCGSSSGSGSGSCGGSSHDDDDHHSGSCDSGSNDDHHGDSWGLNSDDNDHSGSGDSSHHSSYGSKDDDKSGHSDSGGSCDNSDDDKSDSKGSSKKNKGHGGS